MYIQPTSSIVPTSYDGKHSDANSQLDSQPNHAQNSNMAARQIQSRQQLDQMVEQLNKALPEFGTHLSATVVNLGGQSMVEIRNGDTVIRRFSDSELIEYFESKKITNKHLLDQYA